MTKTLPNGTLICNKHCLTETEYKGYKIYKNISHGTIVYSVLIDGKLEGKMCKLQYAKELIDNGFWNK